MDIKLIDEDDIVSKVKKSNPDRREKAIKKKKEKSVSVIRIKYHDKIKLSYANEGKVSTKDAYAVNRGLKDLLKELYYNTDIYGYMIPDDCILVEKDDRMYTTEKYLFIDISRAEFPIIKRQLENSLTVYAYNKGEFSILEGRASFVADTWNVPGIRFKYGQ